MRAEELWGRLERAVMLESDDAAIRIRATYQPQAGPGTKVSPPTYLPSDGSKYHLEKRWNNDGDEVDTVILDSIQSEANRCEMALLGLSPQIGLPHLLLETEVDGMRISISSLEAPHRSRDAYFLDAEDENGTPFDRTKVGKALNGLRQDDATAALRYAPADLAFGVWDSHRGKRVAIRFPRVYTSEMVGEHVLHGRRAATKGDPLNLPGNTSVDAADWRPDAVAGKKKTKADLNELGHGMIPSSPDAEAGGVSVQRIERRAVLSLTGLARLWFPSATDELHRVGRTTIAAVALLGDRAAFSGAGIHLRSGADLVLEDDQLEWVGPRGHREPLQLDPGGAIELLRYGLERLASVGVTWDAAPAHLRPTSRLQTIIEQTFMVPELEAEA